MKDNKVVRHVEKNSKMINVSPSLSIIALSVSLLTSPIKRQRFAEKIF
jgi:hypothetical protein